MSNKVFKNHQINLGLPFQVKIPFDELYDAYPAGAYLSGLFSDGGEPAEFGDEFTGADPPPEEEPVVSEEEKARVRADKIILDARSEAAEIMLNAEKEANRRMNAARTETDKYVSKARDELASEAAETRENARIEGATEGRAEGRAEYDALVAETEMIRHEAEKEYKRLMAGAEADALDLILGIAKKVIGEEIAYNRESLIFMIRDAFIHCTNKEDVVLKVSAGDYEYVLEHRDHLLSMVEGIDNMEIRRDLSLPQGSCYVETPFGNLDAGAATRLSKIENTFYSLLSASRSAADDLIA